GTLDTYKALSDALHKRGMYLIQDVVPNHMGNFFTYSSYNPSDVTQGFVKNTNAVPTSKPDQAPFDQDDATDPTQRSAAIYHWTPAITDYNDPNQQWNYQVSDLDDLNSENPVVRQALRDSYGYWIKEVGVDAFRVDTVKYVPHDFWNDFFYSTDTSAPGMMAAAQAAGQGNFFAFGEVYDIDAPLDDTFEKGEVTSYLGTPQKPELPSVLAYPLYGEIGRVFASGKPTSYMTYRLARFMEYPHPELMPTFVDNHDVQRFLALGTPNGLNQALSFIFTLPGIPIVYYGTEQGFTETRGAMFQGGYKSVSDHFNTSSQMYARIAKLTAMRKASPTFTHGDLQVLYDNNTGPGAFAFKRTYNGDTVLALFNTAEENVLISGLDTGLPAGTVLEVLGSEQAPPAPKVGANGLMQLTLPARAVSIVHATSQVVAPPAPGATIAVTTAIEGQTFTGDVTVSGTITPATDKLWMIPDGYIAQAVVVPVNGDGSWSTTLPVSDYPPGTQAHSVTFYTPDAVLATAPFHFTSNVPCDPPVPPIVVPDPAGDDKGPAGTYSYPQDPTFGHQMDITNVELDVCKATMDVKITMADWSTLWNPPLKFDHVAFNIFFSVPGQPSQTPMPLLQGSTPAGFDWSFDHFAYGWQNAMYDTSGATASNYGAPVPAPTVNADPASKTVTFTYLRKTFGVSSWSGIGVYVSTWDFDGIKGVFRPLSLAGGQWEMGGGQPTDPLIMDDVPPITIP
ncbi:MAG TPA: alpha-amylase family glycosyl hydrolase, partial [Myxococcales bacterium]|nr:alpha-amylase family glycosyl hydrolase [Myxococcales bacterium]